MTVVIVTYRSRDQIDACLKSLQEQSLRPKEIIVVDNASDDSTAEYVKSRFPEVNVLELNANAGFGAGVNAGCSIASTGLIAVFNPDVILAPDCLARLVEPLDGTAAAGASGVGAVTARIINHGEPPETKNGTMNLFGARIPEFFEDPARVFYPSGAAFAFRRSVAVPPFDVDLFLYYEDVWFGWRLRLRGHEVIKVPDAVVHHYPQGSVRSASPASVTFHQEKNRLLVLLGLYSATTVLKLLPLMILDALARVATAPWRGKSAAAIFAAQLTVLLSPRLLIQKRLKWRGEVRTPDSSILPYLSGRWVPGALALNQFLLAWCRLFRIPVAELQGR